jgi:hypothetical protein
LWLKGKQQFLTTKSTKHTKKAPAVPGAAQQAPILFLEEPQSILDGAIWWAMGKAKKKEPCKGSDVLPQHI